MKEALNYSVNKTTCTVAVGQALSKARPLLAWKDIMEVAIVAETEA